MKQLHLAPGLSLPIDAVEKPVVDQAAIEILLKEYPGAVRRDVLDEKTEYKRSTRDTYLQRLQSRRLVEDVGRGEVRASANLFSEALV